MNKPLRHLALVMMVIFALLFGSTSYVQYFTAQSLKDNDLNRRTTLAELGRDRGPLLVDDQVIAQSVPSDDEYNYQRVYGGEGIDPEMYSAVTGFYSVVNGATGLEKSENSMLAGTDDAMFYQQLSGLFTGTEPPGAAVDLTINPDAQEAAWDALGDQQGAAVALNPKTGEILAMVSKPGWDPNPVASHDEAAASEAYQSLIADDDNPAFNRAIGGNLYPPGSTFKLVTAAAAIESGQYNEDSVLESPDALTLPQTTARIRNAGGATCGDGSGRATMLTALAESCNTTFANLGMELGADAMNEQSEAFGFGEEFDIPLRSSPSTFPAEANPPQLAQSSIGQFEVRATPLQMAMVTSAIANDGTLMSPNLVKQVRNSSTLEVIEETAPSEYSRPISSDTAGQLNTMMRAVMTEGTGSSLSVPGVTMAGKSGTSQHTEGAPPHAWFTAFAPADDPEVAVAVVVENGGTAGSEASGGRVAGPVVTDIIEAVVNP